MTQLSKILESIKKQPGPPKLTTLQKQLNKQSAEGKKKKQKAYAKKMAKFAASAKTIKRSSRKTPTSSKSSQSSMRNTPTSSKSSQSSRRSTPTSSKYS